jgi:ribonuclease P protein component
LTSLVSPLAHLVNKAQFDAVFAGKVLGKTAHFALHYVAPAAPQAANIHAIGVVVPKRWARRAVTRNTIKRQVYAVSAACAHSLMLGHYVVRLKTEFSRATFISATSDALKRAVRAELQALFASVSASAGNHASATLPPAACAPQP